MLLATALLSGESLADDVTWSAHTITTEADGANSVYGIDIDGDGDVDSFSASGNTIAWLENVNGDGSTWTRHVISTEGECMCSVFGADVDGDGDIDGMSASG